MRNDFGTPRRTRAQWQDIVARAARSPLSVAEFCRGEGVSAASFYGWRRRLASPRSGASVAAAPSCEGAFVDLGVLDACTGAAVGSAWEIELDLGAGAVLRLRRGGCSSPKRGYGYSCTPARSICANPSMG